jgi:hypothetical protein
LWLHDTNWSHAVKTFLETWLDTSLSAHCGTDRDSQQQYARDLEEAGYRVSFATLHSDAELDFTQLAGGILSALPLSRLPHGDRRQSFIDELRAAVGPQRQFLERVPVTLLIGSR